MSECYNTDCYFYDKYIDGNAIIPECRYHKKLYSCPCDNCVAYIPIKVVDNLARKLVELRAMEE